MDGATAIWVAAFRGHRDLLELLYRKGADLGVEAYCGKEERALEDEERCTPRRIAELKQSNKTVTLIDLLEGKSPDESEK